MTIACGLTATIIFAATAVGLPIPTCADEFNGTYSLDNSGEPGTLTTWIANSTCGPAGCIAQIASSEDGAAMHSWWRVVGL